jgi:hypothetical protein
MFNRTTVPLFRDAMAADWKPVTTKVSSRLQVALLELLDLGVVLCAGKGGHRQTPNVGSSTYYEVAPAYRLEIINYFEDKNKVAKLAEGRGVGVLDTRTLAERRAPVREGSLAFLKYPSLGIGPKAHRWADVETSTVKV